MELTLNINSAKYAELPMTTRVWVYQCTREFTEAESATVLQQALAFVKGWTAHDNQLKALAELRYNRFVVLMVDEDIASASGCSIDKSVKFIKGIEQQLGVQLMDRMCFAYKVDGKVLSCNATQFKALADKGEITNETIVFNNLVANKAELETDWEVPLQKSWHKQFM